MLLSQDVWNNHFLCSESFCLECSIVSPSSDEIIHDPAEDGAWSATAICSRSKLLLWAPEASGSFNSPHVLLSTVPSSTQPPGKHQELSETKGVYGPFGYFKL